LFVQQLDLAMVETMNEWCDVIVACNDSQDNGNTCSVLGMNLVGVAVVHIGRAAGTLSFTVPNGSDPFLEA
jgi:hypothetical protein